jgi:AraC-like DNA-binding protein
MSKHQADTLEPLDLSLLFGVPYKTVIDLTEQALSEMRQKSVVASCGYDLDSKFRVVSNKNICEVCETLLDYSFIEEEGHSYCGHLCLELKHPSVLTLEADCGVEIKEILGWAVKKYKSLPILKEALGISSSLLETLLKDHLGVNITELYPEKPVEVVLNTKNKVWAKVPG